MTHHNFLISLISSAKRSSKQQEKVTGLELSAGISYNQLLLEPKSRGARYVICPTYPEAITIFYFRGVEG
jgi:hypothetical protein